jgi:hypothetical protein
VGEATSFQRLVHDHLFLWLVLTRLDSLAQVAQTHEFPTTGRAFRRSVPKRSVVIS